MDTLRKAIKSARHTQASIARELDVTTQAVNNWIRRDTVPPERAAELEKLLGVDRRKLCPEFPW
jgi:DNA-binding transcriptional regulator YdaS (Cro superfamily)